MIPAPPPPIYIVNPTTYIRTEVPQEIVSYCDYFTYDADRTELRYYDCIYMNMGYYGNDSKILEELRNTPKFTF